MNVVFLSQRVPHPPDRGDRITTYHFLRHFRECGADVRVGCFVEDDADEAAAAELRGMVRDVAAPRIDRRARKLLSLRGFATGEALTIPFFRDRRLAATVNRWLRDDPPDLVYVYSSSMAQFALHDDRPLRIMQFAELDSDKWRQYAAHRNGPAAWVYAREARRLLEFERRVARAFDLSFVVSEVEKELFLDRIPDVTPVVMPNGVDVDHFTTAGDETREPHAIVFTGVMDYEPNVDGVLWFVTECWPTIRAALPDATFYVVGNRPCAEIQRLDGRDGVVVTGRVPETPPWFDRASVAVAPLRLARGVQNKVLEAMSMALPVVSTPQAAQGLGAVDDDTLLVHADADATAASVLRLLRDPATARAIGARAAEYVRARFRWENAFVRLDELLEARGLSR